MPGQGNSIGGPYQQHSQQPNYTYSLPLKQSSLRNESSIAEEDKAISKSQRSALEQAKLNLAANGEFNLIDAFRVFDDEGSGQISTQQIVYGLQNTLDCRVAARDVQQFMSVFDKDQDGYLKYTEFCDAFLPLDHH